MKLENVTFAYGEKTVLDSFSLTLPDSGVTALSGPSGCGKTTLLRLIAGLETPQSGTITAPGAPLTAILFQEDRLLPGLTCSSQLKAVLPRGARVIGFLEAVGLGDQAGTRVEDLSGGMRRRAALARAMAYAVDKRLLILDEPFTGVDLPTARGIMSRLRDLEVPILLTAHDAGSLSMADRVITLSGPPLKVENS